MKTSHPSIGWRRSAFGLLALMLLFVARPPVGAAEAERFKVLFHNLHNYLSPGPGQKAKPEREKLALFKIWQQEEPDILLVCELGGRDQLLEIKDQMTLRGLDYPHTEWVEGVDPVRHVAMLSRFPIAQREPHDKLRYTAEGRELGVSRGFLEADVQVSGDYRIKIYVAHLKSKGNFGPSKGVDQAKMRMNEARLLREKVEEDLKREPGVNLLVAGDLNDTPKSKPVQWILRAGLTDLRPVDDDGYSGTYFNRKQDRYERIDYLLASPGLNRELIEDSAALRDDRTAKIASDHFPVQASFWASEK